MYSLSGLAKVTLVWLNAESVCQKIHFRVSIGSPINSSLLIIVHKQNTEDWNSANQVAFISANDTGSGRTNPISTVGYLKTLITAAAEKQKFTTEDVDRWRIREIVGDWCPYQGGEGFDGCVEWENW